MGPGAAMASRGPVLRLCEEMSGIRQLVFRIDMARGLCASNPASMSNCRQRNAGLQLTSLASHCDLAKQGRISEPVASCSSPRMGRRTRSELTLSAFLPAVRCWAVRQFLRGGKPVLRIPYRCSTRECCARYFEVSSWACVGFPRFCTVIPNGWFPSICAVYRVQPRRCQGS